MVSLFECAAFIFKMCHLDSLRSCIMFYLSLVCHGLDRDWPFRKGEIAYRRLGRQNLRRFEAGELDQSVWGSVFPSCAP